jgi:hypothetical protein
VKDQSDTPRSATQKTYVNLVLHSLSPIPPAVPVSKLLGNKVRRGQSPAMRPPEIVMDIPLLTRQTGIDLSGEFRLEHQAAFG